MTWSGVKIAVLVLLSFLVVAVMVSIGVGDSGNDRPGVSPYGTEFAPPLPEERK